MNNFIMGLKKALSSLIVFNTLKCLVKNKLIVLECILLILSPLLIVFLCFNLSLMVLSILLWEAPSGLYIPFLDVKTELFDRMMLIFGVIILLIKKL